MRLESMQHDVRELTENLQRSRFRYLKLDDGASRIVIDVRTPAGPAQGQPKASDDAALAVLSAALGIFNFASQWQSAAPGHIRAGDLLGAVTVLDEVVEIRVAEAGRVSCIDVADGDFVEFGQALIHVTPGR